MTRRLLLFFGIVTLIQLSPQILLASVQPHFKKVVWIVFENTNYADVMKQSDFAAVAKKGVLFTNMNAAVHPSQGNYFAMIAGSAFGVKHDNNVDLDKPHIGDLLEDAGKDWAVYAEGYPDGSCYTGKKLKYYVRKHNPFISFLNVSTDSRRCEKIKSDKTFDADFQNGSLPEYSMYIPDLRNDAHDTDINYGGKYLSRRFAAFMSEIQKSDDILFVVTFDESGRSSRNQIYTVMMAKSIVPGSTNDQLIDHPTLLKMIEDEFSLGNLGQGDATAPALTGFWK